MNQEKQYSDSFSRCLSSDPRKQETSWTDERPDFAAQAELIRHVQAASPPSPLLAVQSKPVSAVSSSPSSSVAQFTFADAQELWQKWYVLATVPPSEEKIRAYIEAGKRGWKMLWDAWLKPQEEGETEEMGERVGGSGRMDVVEEDEEIVEGGIDISSTSSNMERESVSFVHKDDEVEYRKIIKKMDDVPLTERMKRSTDIHRYGELLELIENARDYPEALLSLNLFFHKNAPLGYNRHDQDLPVYDVTYERDFTFKKEELVPLLEQQSQPSSVSLVEPPSSSSAASSVTAPLSSSDPFLAERKNIEYFRTSYKSPHILRQQFEKILKDYMKEKLEKDVKDKQVYISLDVEVEKEGNQLKIKSYNGSYDNSSFVGAAKENRPTTLTINIGGLDVCLWINSQSARIQSKYAAAGIVPNIIQYQRIINQLEVNPDVEIKRNVEIGTESRTFRPVTREYVLNETWGEEGLVGGYKERMLKDRRTLIADISQIVNDSSAKPILYAVTKEQQSDFLQYPCLCLEPLKDKYTVDTLKEKIIKIVHKSFDISFSNRLSFGFASPTISDVGKSVRIWPGLIPASLFKTIIQTVCDRLVFSPSVSQSVFSSTPMPAGVAPVAAFSQGGYSFGASAYTPSVSQSAFSSTPMPAGVAPVAAFSQGGYSFGVSPYTPSVSLSPLAMALITARMRARERFQRYNENEGALEQAQKLRYIYQWVNNRIVANLIKANELIRLLAENPDEPQFVARAVRTLENLNEYDLIQASAEEELIKRVKKTSEAERASYLLNQLKESVPQNISSYYLGTVKILNSGMAAYRVALETINDAPKSSNRIYFEMKKITCELGSTTPKGKITRLQDPSYNFVSKADAFSGKEYTWPVLSSVSADAISASEELSSTRQPTVHLYDITNTSLVEAAALSLAKEAPDLLVFVESLSKHFQLGMDKTTLGRLIVYVKPASEGFFPEAQALAQQFNQIKDTSLPNFFLNYIEMQSRFFGV